MVNIVPPSGKKLLTSIHDVSPRFEYEIGILLDRLMEQTGSARVAMLVVPDHWGSASLASAPAFQAKLRRWSDQGVEMFAHGWFHREDKTSSTVLNRFRGNRMTAGEGEFLELDFHTALQRMKDGQKMIEDVTGRLCSAFVAPAWLYGRPALDALKTAGFTIAEDHFKVWNPTNGRTLSRGPVITWATRTPARMLSSLAFAAISRSILNPLPVVRVAVHPGDVHEPEVCNSIDRTLRHFLYEGRQVIRYSDLLEQPAAFQKI